MGNYVKIYGCRGSIPVCEEVYQRYGGNTSCTALFIEDKVLVFDAGTGIRKLAEETKEKKEYHIFLSHMHIDHIQGLPLFAPLYDDEATVTIYGIKKEGRSIRSQLYDFLNTSLWPIGDEYFTCQLRYVDMEEMETTTISLEKTEIYKKKQDISVMGCLVDHPGGSAAYRVSYGKKSFGYALDFEHGKANEKALGELLRGAEVMIYDGQYFPEEYERKKGFGHSTWEQGRSFQTEYGIKQLLVSHFDPQHTDTQMELQEKKMKEKHPQGIAFAKEGEEVYFA